jgi:putative transposase
VIARRAWIERDAELAVSRQCALAGVARSWVYGTVVGEALDELDLLLLGLIDAQYTRRPFYGSRRMVVYLTEQGHAVNRKRVQRLMRVLGLAGMAPGPATSRPHPEHKIYPYLLRGVAVVRPNQVWSTDITYIRLEHGFAYLVAVIDWYARRVLAWRISNTLEAGFCVDCLEDALRTHGRPEVFNSDQGSQFTSEAFTGVLLREGVAISMDGRGRALDNIFVERLWRSVKYEDVYLKGYASMSELLLGLTEYFAFYNGERPTSPWATVPRMPCITRGKAAGRASWIALAARRSPPRWHLVPSGGGSPPPWRPERGRPSAGGLRVDKA